MALKMNDDQWNLLRRLNNGVRIIQYHGDFFVVKDDQQVPAHVREATVHSLAIYGLLTVHSDPTIKSLKRLMITDLGRAQLLEQGEAA